LAVSGLYARYGGPRGYFERVWAPRLGPVATALVRAAQARVWRDRERGEIVDHWFMSAEELAAAVGVHRATIFRLFTGPHARDLQQFLVRGARRRYDPICRAGRVAQNMYRIALVDTPPLTEQLTALVRAELLAAEGNATQDADAQRDAQCRRKTRHKA